MSMYPTQTMRRPRLQNRVPLWEFHGPMLMQVLVHVEGVPEEVGLMSPTLLQALEFGHFEVVV